MHISIQQRDTLKQFLVFASIGFLGTLLNITILYLFTEYLGIWYIFSAIAAFTAAMSHNFILNKLITFKEPFNESFLSRYFKFAFVSTCALTVNLFILYMLTEYLGIFYIISQIFAIGAALMINFFGNKKWTFRIRYVPPKKYA